MKPGPPVPVSWRLRWGGLVKQRWSGLQRGACVKPEAPVPSEIALQAACALQRGWFGFQRGRGLKPGPPLCGLLWACVKPGPPLPVSWRLIWGVLVKRGWSGFRGGVRGVKQGWSGFRGLHQPRLPSEPTAPPGRSGLHPDQACRPMGGVTTHGSVGRARRPSIPSARAMSLAHRAPETPRDSPMKATTSEADHPRSRRSRRVTAPSRLARRAPERENARGTCAYVGTGAPSRWASCA